ncbi:hypothetical protein K2173_001735 [Erythroxylum novogranatense]|uniref:Uncharacterized protein n=1 Tax=Erythroxylum novogranatense TaxID=1862640 RepID=A0AAV8S7Z2_9ROSI|nr:hypothetical protein K2173_001735 [Erythroxylum novogranatense]
MNSELHLESQPNIFAQLLQSATASTKSDLNTSNKLSPSSSMDYGVLNMNVESLPYPSRVTPKPCCPLLDHDLHKSPTGLPPLVSSHNYLGTVGTAALRKEYESLADQERKDEYKTRVVERLKKLCVDDALEAKTAVGMEIAQGVDFLKVLDSSHPKLAELVDISDNSREGVAKLIDGLRLVERAQHRLRSVLFNEGASSAQ